MCTNENAYKRMMADLNLKSEALYLIAEQFNSQNKNIMENLKLFGQDTDHMLWKADSYAISKVSQVMTRMLKRYVELPSRSAQVQRMQIEHTMYNMMGTQQVFNFMKQSIADPLYLLKTLAWESPVIQFSKKQAGNVSEMGQLTEMLLSKSKEYEDLGIKVFDLLDRIYIVLDLTKIN